MNHNVYLPDEISERVSERVKAGEINLSGILREAVIEELKRLEALEQAKDGMVQQNIDANTRDLSPVTLRFTGKEISTGPDAWVYLTDNGRVIVIFDEDWTTFDNVGDFADWVSAPTRNWFSRDTEESLAYAVGALGGRVVVDL